MSETEASTGIVQWPETIEHEGLVWKKGNRADANEYTAFEVSCGDLRVCEYLEGPSKGKWFWGVDFDAMAAGKEFKPSVLRLTSGGITETIEEAMDECCEAGDRFIDDMKRLSVALDLNDYATGFKDGQRDIIQKVMGVFP